MFDMRDWLGTEWKTTVANCRTIITLFTITYKIVFQTREGVTFRHTLEPFISPSSGKVGLKFSELIMKLQIVMAHNNYIGR